MVTAVYPGSFDPATYGHLDVIRRASVSFDRVVVGVLQNSAKSPLFSVEERVNILEKATRDIPNVIIKPFDGLSVNFARENQAQVIVRGLRAVTDFEYGSDQPRSGSGCRYRIPDHKSGVRLCKLHHYEGSSPIWRRFIQFCTGRDHSGTTPEDAGKRQNIRRMYYEQQN